MNDYSRIVELINSFASIGFLALVGFALYFRSYLIEKAKSIAKKEDIAALTRGVEEVKDEFERDRESWRNELRVALSKETSYHDLCRNHLIEFHATISEWNYRVHELDWTGDEKNALDIIRQARSDLSKLFAKTGTARAKAKLLVDTPEVISAIDNYYHASVAFHSWSSSCVSSVKELYEDEFFNQGYIEKKEELNDLESLKAYYKLSKEIRQDLKSRTYYFYDNLSVEFDRLLPFEIELSEQIKRYLRD
ncbi:MAG: hypothetical protein EP346_00170 [Bacteroidetes bacterium]|nr:MAG: hypothetical protein EP346_00170 [Bacteroidota bacterium]